MINKNSPHFSPQLEKLFNCLLKDGDELRIVGGAVRDSLSQKEITDIDLACKYLAEKTCLILRDSKIKAVPSGLKYGTITAIIDDKQFQITALRKDIKNFGRDCEVEFIDDFYQDAKRRDFTVNAMSVDFAGNFYDYFGGKKDLANKKIKFIGDAGQRIKEDYLRILRFFRFSCFYADNIDGEALNACIANKEQIAILSAERIKDEFFKILSCQNRQRLLYVLSEMQVAGILPLILKGEINLNRLTNLFELEKILEYKFKPITLLLAICFNSKLNFSKAEKRYLNIIANPKFVVDFDVSSNDLLALLFDFDKQIIIDTFVIKLVSSNNFISLIDRFLPIYQYIMAGELPNFIIDGNDLVAANIAPENIGNALKLCKKYWLENDFLVNKEQIIQYLRHSKTGSQ